MDPLPDAPMDSARSWEPGDGSVADRLWLADWRRRTATLYLEVRTIAATAPDAALDHWRTVRETLYREHPQSPVPAAERSTFRARHFEVGSGLRFELPIEAEPAGSAERSISAGSAGRSIVLPTSAGAELAFRRLGHITIPLPGGERRLSVFWMAGYAGGLFIPFRDATNGVETYAAGRYLIDAAKGLDLGGDPVAGTIVVDFDYAIQPSCAFDPRWACPLAPPENRLDLPIRAGERLR